MPTTTTTIRVDAKTHRQLQELGETLGVSLMETVRAATEALRRQRFGQKVADELAALQKDPSQWSEYLADAESTTVGDGLD